MQEKNVKGIIGLILAIVSLICIFVAWYPMTKLTGMGLDGKLSFYGTVNLMLIVAAFICAVAAIVFAALSKKHKDKVGPRNSGLVIGIICLILSLLCSPFIGLFTTVTEYINSDGERGAIAEAVKNDQEMEKKVNELIDQLKDQVK